MKILSDITQAIGNTPLLRPGRLIREWGLPEGLLLKLEGFNPGGSAKDRPVLSMIQAAEEAGQLVPGGVIVEPTSGNTGIAMATIGTLRGYRVVLVMPDSMSAERRMRVQAVGAELVLTPGAQGMRGAIAKAQEIAAATPGSVMLQQFENPANPLAHERGTAQEIWRDTEGAVDVLVAGVGTGGTLTGTGRALRALKPSIELWAVEPADSPVLAGGQPGPHALQGIGAGFVPGVYQAAQVTGILPVTTAQAVEAARALARLEGVLTGYSGGAALFAARELLSRPGNAGKLLVAIVPDTGERYLSTGLFGGE